MLELDKSKMRFGAYGKQYEEYYGISENVINNEIPSLTFKNIKNEIKPTKNKDLLDKMAKLYAENKMALAARTNSETRIMKNIIKTKIEKYYH